MEQSFLSHSVTSSAEKDISNRSETPVNPDTPNVDGTQSDPTKEPACTSPIVAEEDSPSLNVENETQRSPDSHNIDSTPVGLHTELVRNIIILGKTGTGKATIANMILDHPKFTVSTSVEGITRSAKDSTGSYDRNGVKYNIKLIDTVGVRDTKLRTQHIFREVLNFVHSKDGVHLIIFVFKNSRFTKEDKAAFSFIASMFKPVIKKISLLVITCCEVLSEAARDELVADFKTKESTIADVMTKGILPVGFPDFTTVRIPLKAIYEENAKKDSKELRDLIESCTERVSQYTFQDYYSRNYTQRFPRQGGPENSICSVL